MKYLSVCSGIEAATVAWHPLGWEPLAFSEIEPFPRKVLAHHYPNVPCHGDFTILRDQDWIVDADLLVGGTPCQAFSVAGLRQSLSDDRGNLTLEFVRLADAIDNLRRIRGDKPAVIVWENVPGVLSVQDNAFGCFLAALVGNDAPLVPTGGKWTNAGLVVGPKRSAAWRVLDAQYFGVAQRRRRVFVVAGSGDGFDPAEILFEREGMRRDTAPRREKREIVAPTIGSGPPFSRTGNDRVEADAYVVAKTLTCGAGRNYDSETDNFIVGALGARTGLSQGVQDASVGHMIVHGTQDPCVSDIAFAQGRNNGAENVLLQPIAIHPHCVGRSATSGPQGKEYLEDGSAYTMDSRGVAQAVATPYSIMPMNSGKDYKARETDIAQPLMTSQVGGNQGGDFVVQPINIFGGNKRSDRPQGGFYVDMDASISKTLDAASGLNPTASQGGTAVLQTMAVRRLTPKECERLQGFPDDYTNIPKAADGPRYKALDNSMAVPVMAWIGRRIAEFGGRV